MIRIEVMKIVMNHCGKGYVELKGRAHCTKLRAGTKVAVFHGNCCGSGACPAPLIDVVQVVPTRTLTT